MKIFYYIEKSLLMLFLLGFTMFFTINAQSKIQLIHQSSQEKISFAHFQYASQKGISDELGFIDIQYQAGEKLTVSHVEYGKLIFSDEAIKEALNSETLLVKKSNNVFLQPVTIIGIQENSTETEALTLNYQDKLAHDAGAFLTQTPVMNAIRKSGSYGFDPVLRGFKYDQINIVIDGVQCANAACPNRMDPPASQIPLQQMERVEILKGPYILRFGSVTGGTVNFISTKPTFENQFTPQARFSSAYETNGSIFRNEGLVGFKNEFINFDINGTWSEGFDYQDGDGNTVPSTFSRGSFGASLAIKVSDNQSLEMNATSNQARDIDFPALPMDLRNDDTWLFNFKHSLEFSNTFSWNTNLYFTRVDHLMDNLGKNLNPRMLNAQTDANTQTFGGRTEVKFLFDNSFLYAGMDFKRQEAEGIRTREFLRGPMQGSILEDNAWQKGRIDQTGVFAEYHLLGQKNQLVASARIDFNQASVLDATQEFLENYENTSKNEINPSFSLGLIRDFSDKISLSFWAARSQRSAGLAERYINYFPIGLDPFEMLGNPNLAPEVNNQADLNLNFQNENLSIHLNGFVSYLQDYILSEIRADLTPRLPMSPGVRQFINIDEALISGFEMSITQKLPLALQANFSIAYTYGENLVTAEALPEVAPLDLRLNLSGAFLKGKLWADVTYRHVETQNRFATSFGENRTPGFNVVDLRTTYRFNPNLQFTAGVQNLLNESYFEHLTRSVRGTNNTILATGRNFYFTLSFSL